MKVFLGIEFGSTRIKAVAINEAGKPLAAGAHDWENRLESGIWTYHLDDVWNGLGQSIKALAEDYIKNNNTPIPQIDGIGISAMMHGYLVFDAKNNQLAQFRTWRNTMTAESAEILSKAFNFNIPQRWSIAHLHNAVTSGEEHTKDISMLTTLAGYVHYKLTGKNVVGIGEASGIFPVDSETLDYNETMITEFDRITAEYKMPWKLREILPKVQIAGDDAGCLTEEGVSLLDGQSALKDSLKPGIPFCPPEGDAGTGMVATNAIKPGTGNVSAGTSIFAMFVLDKALPKPNPQIDVVTTPTGKPVAMVHGANCTADLDAWVGLISQAVTLTQEDKSQVTDKTKLYADLYNAALGSDCDCAGLVSVNYLSGEHLTGFDEGRPLFLRMPDSSFTVGNFMRSLLYSSMATLRIGMDILVNQYGLTVSKLLGHGGLFKTPIVAQKLMAGALNTPVAVMDGAGEGGAWGIALLAAYREAKKDFDTPEDFLDKKIFSSVNVSIIEPDSKDVEGYNSYLKIYKEALEVERAAVESIKSQEIKLC